MDEHEQSAMGLDSQAVSDRVTKQIVTIFSKTFNKYAFLFNFTAGVRASDSMTASS